MIGRYIPDWLRHAPAPGARSFALLSGTEATMRAMLVSVWPLVMYEALRSAEKVSAIYFVAGIIALSYGMMVPWVNRHVPRRWLFTAGTGFYMGGPALAIIGGPVLTPLGMMMTGWGTMFPTFSTVSRNRCIVVFGAVLSTVIVPSPPSLALAHPGRTASVQM